MAARINVIEIDRGWSNIEKNIRKMGGAETRVGLFGSGGGADENLAARASVQEYGSRRWKGGGRPFMRQSFDKNVGDLERLAKKEYDQVVDQKQSVSKMVKTVGAWMEGKIKETITTGNFRPLKPATIRAKGSSTPLIDTGQMRNSITHKDKVR